MRRSILIALMLGLFIGVVSLSAKENQPKFKFAEVKQFTNWEAVGMPEDFARRFDDQLRAELMRDKLAAQVVNEGAVVPDADAADSIVIEGKFTEFNVSGRCALKRCDGHVGYEINIYRKSDHALIAAVTHVTSIRGDIYGGYWKTGGGVADSTREAADLIKKAFK
jgi:hypothetical protein